MKQRGYMAALVGVLLFLFLLSEFSYANPSVTISGKVQTLPISNNGPTPLSGATIRINGTDITTTSDDNGRYSLSIPTESTYILSATKTDYVKSYTMPTSIGDTSNIDHDIFTLLNTELTTWYTGQGLTRDTTKGTLFVITSASDLDSMIFGATGIIKGIDGTNQGTIKYVKMDGTIVSSPDATEGTGTVGFIGFNVPAGVVMVSASKQGKYFIYRPAFIFANCLTSGVSPFDEIIETNGTMDFSGTLRDENDAAVGNASVSLCGMGISATTNSSGAFILSGVLNYSTVILKSTKSGYKDTYYITQLKEGEKLDDLHIISASFANTLAGQAGITIDTTKGSFAGGCDDYYHNSVKGANVDLFDETGNKMDSEYPTVTPPHIYYFNSEGMEIDKTLTETSDPGAFVSFNHTPAQPIYLRYVKEGYSSSYQLTGVMPNGITFTDLYSDLELGHLYGKEGEHNPPAGTITDGQKGVPMLQIKLGEATNYENVSLQNDTIIITASGSGSEQQDIAAVYLYYDGNGNGVVDPGEPLLETKSGTDFNSNRTLTFNPNFAIPKEWTVNLLVVYDFKGGLTGGKTYSCSVIHPSDIHGTGETSGKTVSVDLDTSEGGSYEDGAFAKGNVKTLLVTGVDITVDPTAIDFGTIDVGKSSNPTTITVLNSGTLNLNTGQASTTNPTEFIIINDNVSNQTITPGNTRTLQVKFTPSSSGTKSATLNIYSNDSDKNPVTVTLSGTGHKTESGGGGGGGGCGSIGLDNLLFLIFTWLIVRRRWFKQECAS